MRVYLGKIQPEESYKLVVFVQDGGSFDLDGKKNGVVVDPLGLVEAKNKQGDDSSSGCNTGYGIVALLLAGFGLVTRKYRKA